MPRKKNKNPTQAEHVQFAKKELISAMAKHLEHLGFTRSEHPRSTPDGDGNRWISFADPAAEEESEQK